jgi:hypothetical protein
MISIKGNDTDPGSHTSSGWLHSERIGQPRKCGSVGHNMPVISSWGLSEGTLFGHLSILRPDWPIPKTVPVPLLGGKITLRT